MIAYSLSIAISVNIYTEMLGLLGSKVEMAEDMDHAIIWDTRLTSIMVNRWIIVRHVVF